MRAATALRLRQQVVDAVGERGGVAHADILPAPSVARDASLVDNETREPSCLPTIIPLQGRTATPRQAQRRANAEQCVWPSY
jgi:hypothetical protein